MKADLLLGLANRTNLFKLTKTSYNACGLDLYFHCDDHILFNALLCGLTKRVPTFCNTIE